MFCVIASFGRLTKVLSGRSDRYLTEQQSSSVHAEFNNNEDTSGLFIILLINIIIITVVNVNVIDINFINITVSTAHCKENTRYHRTQLLA